MFSSLNHLMQGSTSKVLQKTAQKGKEKLENSHFIEYLSDSDKFLTMI